MLENPYAIAQLTNMTVEVRTYYNCPKPANIRVFKAVYGFY